MNKSQRESIRTKLEGLHGRIILRKKVRKAGHMSARLHELIRKGRVDLLRDCLTILTTECFDFYEEVKYGMTVVTIKFLRPGYLNRYKHFELVYDRQGKLNYQPPKKKEKKKLFTPA